MKTCAYCGKENEEKALVCSGCGTKLPTQAESEFVDPRLTDPAFDPVVIARFRNLQEASIFVDALEEAGIEGLVPEEYGQMFSGVVALDPVTVRVAAKDLHAAKVVLKETFPEAALTQWPRSDAKHQSELNPGPLNAKAAQPPEPGEKKLCVACQKSIPSNAVLCPKCGWTQPC